MNLKLTDHILEYFITFSWKKKKIVPYILCSLLPRKNIYMQGPVFQKNITQFHHQQSTGLNLSTLWANSADTKLLISILICLEKRVWHSMKIIS